MKIFDFCFGASLVFIHKFYVISKLKPSSRLVSRSKMNIVDKTAKSR
nr:MAG TPA: hypothetical protein [Caudoviricetes sp.]